MDFRTAANQTTRRFNDILFSTDSLKIIDLYRFTFKYYYLQYTNAMNLPNG